MTSRVKGPGDGPSTIDPTAGVDAPEGVGEVAPAATEAVGAVSATAPAATDAIAQVAAKLRAGEITVERAVELLIDDVIERQVGRATENAPELAQKLRELLGRFSENDPFLAARIRRLTLSK
jgi:hypothetical protein